MNQNEKTKKHLKPIAGSACDPDLVRRFVDSQVDGGELLRLENHLGDCLACQTLIESETANSENWSEAIYSLRDNSGWSLGDENSELDDGSESSSAADQLISKMVLKSLAPSDDPGMLGRIGAYEVSGVIGQGGMGVVLKAHDLSLNRIVALKVLRPYLAISGAARQRFFREARAAATINHENVMPIHSVGESSSELPYLVMPYVRGESLQQRIARSGPLSTAEVVRVGMQVASGLNAAHDQGLVHRDIKPANIILEEGVDKLWITDFGLARLIDDASLTRTGVIAGTPEYMSPEQARGDAVDERSDLFSLGALMYAAATGHPPFRAPTSFGVLRRITDDEPRSIREINAHIPDWLESFIFKLLSKDADKRVESANEASVQLKESLAHLQHPTAFELPESMREAAAKLDPKLRTGWLAAALWLIVAIGLFGFLKYAADVKTGSDNSKIANSSDKLETGLASPVHPPESAPELMSRGMPSSSVPIQLNNQASIQTSIVPDKNASVPGVQWNDVGSEQILPTSTAVWFSIRDVEQFKTNFDKTQLGELIKSGPMRPFVEQFGADGATLIDEYGLPTGIDIWDKKWMTREVSFGFVQRSDRLDRREYLPIVMIYVKGQEGTAFREVAVEFAKLENAKQNDIVLGDGSSIRLTTYGPPTKRRKVVHGVGDGWLVISERPSLVEELLGNAKKLPKLNLSENPSFKKSMSRTRLDVKPDIVWYADPLSLLELRAKRENDRMKPKNDWTKILRAEGFDVFSGLGGRIAFATEEHELVQRTFICHSEDLRAGAKPGKILQPIKRANALGMFEFPNLDSSTSPPEWAREDQASCLVVDWNKSRALQCFGPIYDAFIGENGSFARLLNDFKIDPDLRLDIRKLVEQFDHRTTVLWSATKADDGKVKHPVIGLKLSGDPSYVLDALRRATDGKRIKIAGYVAIEVEGATTGKDDGEEGVFKLPKEAVDLDDIGRKYYLMVDNVLLVSNSKKDLQDLLAKNVGKLVESQDYLNVHAALAKLTMNNEVRIRHFGRLDLSLRYHFDSFRAGKFELFEWIDRDRNGKDPESENDTSKPKPKRKRFDGSNLPANFDKDVAPFLGLFGWVLESEEDGWTITGCILKN